MSASLPQDWFFIMRDFINQLCHSPQMRTWFCLVKMAVINTSPWHHLLEGCSVFTDPSTTKFLKDNIPSSSETGPCLGSEPHPQLSWDHHLNFSFLFCPKPVPESHLVILEVLGHMEPIMTDLPYTNSTGTRFHCDHILSSYLKYVLSFTLARLFTSQCSTKG